LNETLRRSLDVKKPQLSPWLAASLIKNAPQISGLHANRRRSLGCNGKLSTTIAGRVMPIFIGFLQLTGAARAKA
jgi:hypothetical protein